MTPERVSSLFSLARTRRRISHGYSQWAQEAEANGNLEEYRRCLDEASKFWCSAKWALDMAQSAKRLVMENQPHLNGGLHAQDH